MQATKATRGRWRHVALAAALCVGLATKDRCFAAKVNVSRPGFGRAPPVAEPGRSRALRKAAEEVKLSSMRQSTVNLVKNIVGAGMLSLPAGVAAFSSSPQAVLPSLALSLLAAFFSAYGFVLIAEACEATGEHTYTKVWARTVSSSTQFLPAIACLLKAAIGCIAFSMILGDCISLMIAPLNLPAVLASRDSVILMMTALVLYPLCSLKSLAPLAKFSLLGVLSNFYICAFIALRCADGSYAKGGSLFHAAPAAPKFLTTHEGMWSTLCHPGISVLLSILATAYLAHYNAPLFYEQLAPDAKTGKKDKRFFIVSVLGFCISGLIFGLVLAGGFLTFGKSSMGLILNNYAATDGLAVLARAAIVLSLVTAYPLVFLSLRKQVVEVLGTSRAKLAEEKPRLTTVLLLGGVTAIALRLQNLGIVAALAGASLGTFLVYVAPALMILGAQQRELAPRPKGLGGLCARALQIFLVPLGVSLGIIGVVHSLK